MATKCIASSFIFDVLLIIAACRIQLAAPTCTSISSSSYRSYRFGTNCGYMCKCLGNIQCDDASGSCPNGCDVGWYGPGCQYRNIAEGQYALHLDNQSPAEGSENAIDRDVTTCSKTNMESAAPNREHNPWWKVWLPNNQAISELTIVTQEDSLKYFEHFYVHVEYVLADQKNSRTDIAQLSEICYQHTNVALNEEEINIKCDHPIIGNQVRIELASKRTQLVLCDVKINGGRILAFGRNTTQISTRPDYPSSNAVDGIKHYSEWESCIVTEDYDPKRELWWNVDLGYLAEISYMSISIHNRGRISGFQILAWNNTPTEEHMVYDSSVNGHVTELAIVGVSADNIKIRRQTAWRMIICEVQIFGDCVSGKCGRDCSLDCHCKSLSLDDRMTGVCTSGCQGRWTGQDMACNTECDNTHWGTSCQNQCGHCNNTEPCDVLNGYCLHGCKDGYKRTESCEIECDQGTYGENCLLTCSGNCKDDSYCNKVTGNCIMGCSPGYRGAKCDKECDLGTYGENCLLNCSGNCKDDPYCNRTSGSCNLGCIPGYRGEKCDTQCDNGTFGANCTSSCSANCEDVCDNEDGTCTKCASGWTGMFCELECENGTHGINCSTTCGNCNSGNVCDKATGACPDGGCSEGFIGDTCVRALEQTSDPVGGVVGGVSAVLVIIIAVVVVLLFLRRNQKLPYGKTQSIKHADIEHVDTADIVMPDNMQGEDNVYVNSTALTEDNRDPKDKSKQSDNGTDAAEVYYNTKPIARQRKTEHDIPISELEAYVTKRLATKDKFNKEFQKIPYGLQHPTSVANRIGNNGKNRYKSMYAYDHARVVLEMLPDEPHSDYINASVIKGHIKEHAYIAAQGPTDFIMNDFWRMIWEKDVHTIAMTTNLVENTKMKCVQYWPDAESTKQYGRVNVHMESEDVYAEFTIRHLKVHHEVHPNTVRDVTQYHYTAWPDKDVPRSTSSLLHFWYKVRQSDENKTHPWLIHCSAGVGRTGTFTALDILFDQGKYGGFVNVYQCVKDLRDQRVNMVHMPEQYQYLHNIVVEALVLQSQPVHTDEFQQTYSDLKHIDRKSGTTKLMSQYQTLGEATYRRSDPADDRYTDAKHTVNRNQNRYDNILASNECRPFLSTYVTGCTHYINAVYLPSYRNTHSYILTQIPLKNTAIDCCRLVFEQEINVIVTFDDAINEEIGTYLPETGSLNLAPFTTTKTTQEDKQHYTIRKHQLCYHSEERGITQLIYKHWPPTMVTPKDPKHMLVFLQELDTIHRKTGNKPIIIQCLNGAERSGLIAVMMNILERARFENEVSITQVIRQLRTTRQQIIPNFEQFQFCHDVFLAYAESNSIYANM